MKQTQSKAIPADQFYSEAFKFPLSVRIIPPTPTVPLTPPKLPELRDISE